MGQALLAALPQFPQLTLHAAVTNEGHPDVGSLVQGIAISTDLPAALQGADVAIDFSSAAVASQHLQACANAGVALLMGTTGLAAEVQAQIDAAALRIPVIVAANTSLALNVLLALVRRAAAALPADYDIEIFEAHHRHKVDAPSGTALALGALNDGSASDVDAADWRKAKAMKSLVWRFAWCEQRWIWSQAARGIPSPLHGQVA